MWSKGAQINAKGNYNAKTANAAGAQDRDRQTASVVGRAIQPRAFT